MIHTSILTLDERRNMFSCCSALVAQKGLMEGSEVHVQ
jgi:hypothetical protein